MRRSILFLALAAPLSAQTEITISCPPGQMKYDRTVIRAKPGEKIRINFHNKDAMPHNLVVCRPKADGSNDKGIEVAQKAWLLAQEGDAKGWVPEDARVLAHSPLVAAHGTGTVQFQMPEEPGIYPYVCTFPGHAMLMNGEIRVLSSGAGLQDAKFRLFLGDWDRIPDFSKLKPHREGALPDNLLQVNLEGMANHFGVEYTAKFTAPKDGDYRFILASDDGSRLFIDGKQVLEHDGIHPSSDLRVARVKLTQGTHDFRLEYFEGAGEEQLYLAWAGPGFGETPLSKWIHPSRAEGAPEQEQQEPMALAPQNGEPVIYRNFLDGVSPRGLAVGYANSANVCFDADQMALAMIWRGAFIDARRHWTDRGGGTVAPLGFDVVRLMPDKTAGLALLADARAPWPAHTQRAEGIQFQGYRLNERREPVLRYRMGNVSVQDSLQPEGDYTKGTESLVRTLTFTADGTAPANLWLRLASDNVQAAGTAWKVGGRATITAEKGTPQLREAPSRDLLVPVTFTGTAAEIRVRYAWLP